MASEAGAKPLDLLMEQQAIINKKANQHDRRTVKKGSSAGMCYNEYKEAEH
jgi:hypothetical protein